MARRLVMVLVCLAFAVVIALALFPAWWRPLTLGQVLAALNSQTQISGVVDTLDQQSRDVRFVARKGPRPYGPDIRAIQHEVHWVDRSIADIADLEMLDGDQYLYGFDGIRCSSSLMGGLWSDGDVVVWLFFSRNDGTVVAWWVQHHPQ